MTTKYSDQGCKVGSKIPPPVFTGGIYRYFPAWQIRLKWQIMVNITFLPQNQGSQTPDFGAEIRPHSQCQKECFFPNFRQKNFFFFFGGGGGVFSIFISYNTIQNILLHRLTISLYIKKKGKFNYWNQSSNGNVIQKDDVKFPNFSQNTANFPNSMGPGPIPKKGCESPENTGKFDF